MLGSVQRGWVRRVATTLLVMGVVSSGLATIAAPASAEIVPPFPDCVPGANPGTQGPPSGYPAGTQCRSMDSGGASLSPARSQIGFGQSVTYTYSASNVGDQDNPNWGISWSFSGSYPWVIQTAGCGSRDLTCTLQYNPGGQFWGLRGVYWQQVGAFSGGGRGAYAGVWVTPTMYQVSSRPVDAQGNYVLGGSTKGGVAVRPGSDPMLPTCLNRQGLLGGSDSWYGPPNTRPWWPTDGVPDCIYARYINANNPSVYPDWAFGLPPGQWDLYYWDDLGPTDGDGKARQPTPYSMQHVTVGDADQVSNPIYLKRPRPTARIELDGRAPVPIGEHRTLKVTIDAGTSNGGYADVRFDPAELGVVSSNPAAADVVSGPSPAPVSGDFRMFGGQQRVFTYDVVAKAEGDPQFTVKIRSTDDNGVVTTSTSSAGMPVRNVRELQLWNVSTSPQNPADGQPFTVTADVVNTGNIAIDSVHLTDNVDPSVPGGADLGTPSPSTIASIAAGAQVRVSFPGTLRDGLGATVRLQASGVAHDNGSAVSVSERTRVGKPPAVVSVSVDGPRTIALSKDDAGNLESKDVEYTYTLRNDGLGTLRNVELLRTPYVERTGATTQDPIEYRGPWPNSFVGTLAPGQSVTRTFPFTARRAGTFDLVAEVRASTDDDTFEQESRIHATVGGDAALELDSGKLPKTATKDETVDLPLVVRNPTDDEISDIVVDLPTFTDVEPEIVQQPSGDDVGFTLQAGQERTVLFKVKYADVGRSKVHFTAKGDRDVEGQSSATATGELDHTIEVSEESALTWAMVPRFTGQDTVATDAASAQPKEWKIRVKLAVDESCAGTELDLTKTIDGHDSNPDLTQIDGTACEWEFTVPKMEEFDLRAELKKDNDTIVDVTEHLDPKDILIISAGDSMSSGEGVKDPDTGWALAQCNRSINAGPAQAALKVEDDGDPSTHDDEHSSVTFVHLACSGANTPRGLLGSYAGINPALGSPLPPQLLSIPSVVGERKVDALLLTSGINDINFSQFLFHCLDNDACAATPINGVMPGELMDQRIGALPAMYDQLSGWMTTAGVDPSNVYLLEYPDPSKDENGEYCDTDYIAKHITPLEYRFLDERMQTPLNAAGAAGAAAHGWNRVGGVAAAFRTHGLCATDRWSNTVGDSVYWQGDTNGSFHPNFVGHSVFGSIIYDAMKGRGVGEHANGTSTVTGVDGDTPAGSDRVELRNSHFDKGDVVTINPGGANAETRRVQELGSLIFDSPLRYDHADGELIVRTSDLPPTTGANRPPATHDDEFTVAPVGDTYVDVLANDVDPDGDALYIQSWGGSDHWSAAPTDERMLFRPTVATCDVVTYEYRPVDERGATGEIGRVTLRPLCSTLSASVADSTVNEGSPAQLAATVTGAAGPAAVTWDLDGDGEYDDATGSTATLAAPDGPATKNVAARVVDQAGRVATTTAKVTIVNVAPTGVLGAPATGTVGVPFTVSVSSVVDVPADTVALTYSCGGGPFGPSAVCAPTAPGPYAVAARLDDGDGGVTTLTGSVAVAAAPVVTAPDTIITTGPVAGASTTEATAVFNFVAVPGVGSTFQCALDGGPWAACTSPRTLTGLTTAAHTFAVRAVGAGGADPSPATRTWSVTAAPPRDTVKPVTSLVSPKLGEVWSGTTRTAALWPILPPIVSGTGKVVVTATDNVAVTSMVFRINGAVVPASSVTKSGTSYSISYRASWFIAVDQVSWTASDAAGNAASGEVTILGFR